MSYLPPAPRQDPNTRLRPPSRNLWLIGGATVASVAIVLTTILVITHLTAGGTDDVAGGGESGPGDAQSGDTSESGSGSGESAGFSEETCAAFDLTVFEETFGSAHDPAADYTAASSGEGYSSLSCEFATEDANEVSVYAFGWQDSEAPASALDVSREGFEDSPDFAVTDLVGFGDAGYRTVYESTYSVQVEYHFVRGALEVKASTSVPKEDLSAEDAAAILTDISEQTVPLLEDHV